MHALIDSATLARQHAHVRLVLESFDSADECSFQHWIEVCRLVDEDDETGEILDTEVIAELAPAAWN
jgi:hypothetical protein